MKYVLFFFLIISMLLSSCTPKKPMLKEKWFDNPNGISELALTMRDMFDEMAVMKFRIENGKKVNKAPSFDRLLTATPTEADMKNSTYEGFATAWLASLEEMKSTTMENQQVQYETLINTCIACHNNSCPGPIVRIEKLFIK